MGSAQERDMPTGRQAKGQTSQPAAAASVEASLVPTSLSTYPVRRETVLLPPTFLTRRFYIKTSSPLPKAKVFKHPFSVLVMIENHGF